MKPPPWACHRICAGTRLRKSLEGRQAPYSSVVGRYYRQVQYTYILLSVRRDLGYKPGVAAAPKKNPNTRSKITKSPPPPSMKCPSSCWRLWHLGVGVLILQFLPSPPVDRGNLPVGCLGPAFLGVGGQDNSLECIRVGDCGILIRFRDPSPHPSLTLCLFPPFGSCA